MQHLFILGLDSPRPRKGEVCLPLWPELRLLQELAAAVEGAHVVDALAASPLPSDQPDGGKGDTAEDSKSNSETDEKRQVCLDGLGGFPSPGVVPGGLMSPRVPHCGARRVLYQVAWTAHCASAGLRCLVATSAIGTTWRWMWIGAGSTSMVGAPRGTRTPRRPRTPPSILLAEGGAPLHLFSFSEAVHSVQAGSWVVAHSLTMLASLAASDVTVSPRSPTGPSSVHKYVEPCRWTDSPVDQVLRHTGVVAHIVRSHLHNDEVAVRGLQEVGVPLHQDLHLVLHPVDPRPWLTIGWVTSQLHLASQSD